MKLQNIEFIRLLPQFMREDKAVQGLASAIDKLVPEATARIMTASTWDCIDKLREDELDALAWEKNIFWYDYGADISIKRELVKNCGKVHKALGTKWAVENVIKTYFGTGKVEEWFEYGGEPGHFRVRSSNPSVSQDAIDDFTALLNKVKRASAKLDGIFIDTSGTLTLAAGVAMHEAVRERHVVSRTI